MPQPRRLPSPREVPWAELRQRAGTAFRYLQAGWDELTAAERAEVRHLVTKSRGRPRNLTKAEARRLGGLAARAATAARKRR